MQAATPNGLKLAFGLKQWLLANKETAFGRFFCFYNYTLKKYRMQAKSPLQSGTNCGILN